MSVKDIIIEMVDEILSLRERNEKLCEFERIYYDAKAEIRITNSQGSYRDTTQNEIMQQFSIIHAIRMLLILIERHEINPELFFEHLDNLLTTKSEADLKHYIDLIEEKHSTPP